MPTVNRYVCLKEFLHFYIVFVKQLTHGAIYIPVRNQTPIKQGIMHSFLRRILFFAEKCKNIFEKVKIFFVISFLSIFFTSKWGWWSRRRYQGGVKKSRHTALQQRPCTYFQNIKTSTFGLKIGRNSFAKLFNFLSWHRTGHTSFPAQFRQNFK